jgi:hypothetical protein
LQGILDLEGYKAFSTWHEKHVYQVWWSLCYTCILVYVFLLTNIMTLTSDPEKQNASSYHYCGQMCQAVRSWIFKFVRYLAHKFIILSNTMTLTSDLKYYIKVIKCTKL